MTEAECYIKIYGYENFKCTKFYDFAMRYADTIHELAKKIGPRLFMIQDSEGVRSQ